MWQQCEVRARVIPCGATGRRRIRALATALALSHTLSLSLSWVQGSGRRRSSLHNQYCTIVFIVPWIVGCSRYSFWPPRERLVVFFLPADGVCNFPPWHNYASHEASQSPPLSHFREVTVDIVASEACTTAMAPTSRTCSPRSS